jgi:hypothetical protein
MAYPMSTAAIDRFIRRHYISNYLHSLAQPPQGRGAAQGGALASSVTASHLHIQMNAASLGVSYDVVKRYGWEVARSPGYAMHVDPVFSGNWGPARA